MKESFWGYWLIALGVGVIIVMMLISSVSTTNTQDYYILKEISEAAMVDAVDYGYYRESSELRINKEKFVENFLRRLAESIPNGTSTVNFYNLYESPPKVSVEVTSKSSTYQINSSSETFDIINRVDSLLETNLINDNQKIENNNTTSNNNPSNNNSSSNPNNNNNNSSTNPNNNNSSSTNTNSSNNNNNSNSPTNNNKPSNSNKEDQQCLKGITTKKLKNMKGLSMVSGNYANVYHTYNDISKNKVKTKLSQGKKFTILGEKGKYWAISYDGECGWVNSDYMAINLKDYIPNIEYNITNYSGSIYKSSGKNLANITGKKLYKGSYSSFVPATYSFAKLLKKAAQYAKSGGDTLVVYDAYRPKSVSTAAASSLKKLMNSNSTVRNNINYSSGIYWGESWFLAQGLSAHNTACAVDITIKGQKMPTAMHELSTKAIKYSRPIKVRNQSMNYHRNNYAKGMTNAAKRLDEYMTKAGLDDLASEWWHYQEDGCHTRIKAATSGKGANFWSNV